MLFRSKAHERYRPDDNARDRAVSVARRNDPAADRAAQAVVIYDLQRAGAVGLAPVSRGQDEAREVVHR